ncbi:MULTISPECIES: shikimate dehydrogenase [unclassified Spirosoma]|uniref:shikimate dehydrogenase family protein n=1 Tax=unclassified Spirosoma TaxID=2621999 RepID=UPI000969C388|nr:MULTISPECIES: shikimate dehydrogenase [unclassified Spirosoma]MBN8825264.1 shikimate dehydrogenase [Spirosoma sp.]OJW75253.1 MAG: shikimate dehydrogenase [Spirosoma sp. 48-14]
MNRYGLIGFPLTHSFSQRYFSEKFRREGIENSQYDLFELPDITALPELLTLPNLRGLNVTIPHKQAVLPYLNRLDTSAEKIGAVNVIKLEADGSKIGYNSDYYGFRQSLTNWLTSLGRTAINLNALVLGTGGASKAVTVALSDLGIPYKFVSRTKTSDQLTYDEVEAFLPDYHLLINGSPIGTYPKIDQAPALPYHLLTNKHLLYDLVYNPAETLFMKRGLEQGAAVHNGLRMLELQAEKAWEIWQS